MTEPAANVPAVATLPLAEVALDCPGRDSYSYRVPDHLVAEVAPGDCVTVPFGPRTLRGFVLTVAQREPPAGVRLRDIVARVPGVRVPAHLLRLIQWGARYYRCSLGEFLAGAVPAPVREGTSMERLRFVEKDAAFAGKLTARQAAVLAALPAEPLALAEACRLTDTDRAMFERLATAGAVRLRDQHEIQEIRLEVRAELHPLTDEQQVAVAAVAAALDAGRHQPFLLYGVTGSGKTLVYLELAERVIAAGKQVLLLLPEIALTPQLAARVRMRFARVAVWHSGFTDGERAELWRRIHAGELDLVVGTRSALFAPLPAPGLIIVDEEHEQSYKQESVPRYHARDLAVVYAGQLGIPILMGSATPALESVHNGRTGKYTVLQLRNRPLGGKLPAPLLIDMRAECHAQKRAATISRELIERLRAVREKGEQAIILLNRRGWSPVVSCQACGHTLMCRNCDISMTYHKGAGQVRCHYCGDQAPLPKRCPACSQDTLTTQGLGTEQLAAQLVVEIPELKLLRVDADTVNERQGHAKLFQAFARGEAECLVGTQMVAKGLDFPRVTLVGIIAADRGLAIPEFRAAERTFQLVAQVAGRAGRGERPGVVVVQAFDTEALPLQCALHHRPKTFFDAELRLREEYGYPPYAGLVRVLWSGESAAAVQLLATAHGERLRAASAGCTILGPNPASLAFLKGQHRWHALIKAPSRGAAQGFLDRLMAAGGLAKKNGVHVAIDVDPFVTS
ncbi:MAG: primosomal protein N' [Planctomycetes bacterium]|nr:primosomal protein N' [Planctomycetota bacterium]